MYQRTIAIAAVLMAAALTAVSSTILMAVYADESETDTDQENKQKNVGSGDSNNNNCVENLIDSDTSDEDCTDNNQPRDLESATLSVCKGGFGSLLGSGFTFTVTGNNPSPAVFTVLAGAPTLNCVDVTIGPGEFTVTEAAAFTNFLTVIEDRSDCVQDPIGLFSRRASGEIQAGEIQECIFFNVPGD